MTNSSYILFRLAKWYREHVHIRALDVFLKAVLNASVSVWARAKRFSFPEKYSWEWKAEMLSSNYERDTTDLFKKIISPGMTVLDIGAHIGYFTRLFARLTGPSGKVFAFEPDPYNFSILKKNTRHFANIEIVNSAVSDTNGVMDFYEVEGSTGCHTTIRTSAPARKLSVRSTTIDSFVQARGISIDIIKMDIEGGEPRALLGMRGALSLKRPLTIVLELNPDALKGSGTTPAKVIGSLQASGFKGYGIFPNGERGSLHATLEGMKMYQGKTEYANAVFEKDV